MLSPFAPQLRFTKLFPLKVFLPCSYIELIFCTQTVEWSYKVAHKTCRHLGHSNSVMSQNRDHAQEGRRDTRGQSGKIISLLILVKKRKAKENLVIKCLKFINPIKFDSFFNLAELNIRTKSDLHPVDKSSKKARPKIVLISLTWSLKYFLLSKYFFLASDIRTHDWIW